MYFYANSYQKEVKQVGNEAGKLPENNLNVENDNSENFLERIDSQQQSIDPGYPQQQLVPATANMDSHPEGIVLTDHDKRHISELVRKIVLSDPQSILQYALGAQQKVSDFADSTLGRYRLKDFGQIGDLLLKLSAELKSFTNSSASRKGLFSLFRKGTDRLTAIKNRYPSVQEAVNKISDDLEKHKIQLLKDVSMLDKMYEINMLNIKELTLHIIAGEQRLMAAENTELPAIKHKAEQSRSLQDTQAAKDFEEMCNMLDRKIHDLQLSHAVSMQLALQIRLMRNNDSVLVEKIQSSIVNTIPLWKNQMVLALGLANSQKALRVQKAVTDVTNELLKSNADMLRINTVEIAHESERGIIDIETIQYTNNQLISTLEEVIQIREEGKQRRRAAEAELVQIQSDLTNKLLSVKK